MSEIDELLLRYQEGDMEAANLLVVRSTPMLYRSVRPFVGSPETAEEVLQQTWLRVHNARHTWRRGESALPWLLAIARYTRLDFLRKAYRQQEREHGWDALVTEPAAAPVVNVLGKSRDLDSLLEALPHSQREVVLMLKGEGLSLEEVACATSSTIGSVKQKASRAYATLRKMLRNNTGLDSKS